MSSELTPRPKVKRRCGTCERVVEANYDWRWGIISPSGTEHAAYDNGETVCGKDATGDRWWWPL